MALGVTASVVGIATGINSLTGGGITNALGLGGGQVGGGTGQGAQQAADPFAPYRANLGAMYSAALQPGAPTNIQSMPGYSQYKSGVIDPALQSVQSADAATGRSLSSGENASLLKTAQQGYYGFMTDYLNRLAQGSGAVNNPAAAASLGVNQGNLNQAGVMQGFGGLATGIAGLDNQISGGSGGTTAGSWVGGGAGGVTGSGMSGVSSGVGGIIGSFGGASDPAAAWATPAGGGYSG